MSNNLLIKNEMFKGSNLYKKLFENIDINKRDKKGRNALFWAMYNKDYILIEFLIKLTILTSSSTTL